jgi:hypothetical protein
MNATKVMHANDPVRGSFSSFDICKHFSNGLPMPVIVTMRNGLSVYIPPGNGAGRYSQDFTVQVRYYCARGVNIDMAHLLDEVDENVSSVELRALKTAIEHSVVSPISSGRHMGLDYHVSKRDLETNGGSVYLEELDIVLSLGVQDLLPVHPHSRLGKILQLTNSEKYKASQTGFLFSMEIVDNKQMFGDRFINYCGVIYRVPAVRDPERVDGVYLNSSLPSTDASPIDLNFTSTRMEFTQASKQFSLYMTAEEAKTYGDPVKEREKELKALEHDMRERHLKAQADLKDKEISLSKLKSKLSEEEALRENLQLKHQEEIQQAQREYQLLKAEMDKQAERYREHLERVKHEREMESLHRKDYYESRKLERNDSSEMLKWVPIIIAGIGAIWLGVS